LRRALDLDQLGLWETQKEGSKVAPKDRGNDKLKDYSGINIDGYQGLSGNGDEALGSLKQGYLADGRNYLTSRFRS
jgi:hypothetical protein